jgi:phosphonate transport system permease protein
MTTLSKLTEKADANEVYKLPPKLFDARCKACWFILALILLTIASFWTLNLQWTQFFSFESAKLMGKFIGELMSPDFSSLFVAKLWTASLETLGMSLLGTIIAAILGLLIALPASKTHDGDKAYFKGSARLLLNALRSIPELVWAALLLIAAGLGPFAGTLALGLHTAGVLGRLFAESIENAPPEAAFALRTRGVGEGLIFWYATLPQIIPQLMSYTLYRWENNIRAAAVLGVVGGGGLGQMLAFHMGLFQMSKTSTILLAMLALVALVDALSYASRKWLVR